MAGLRWQLNALVELRGAEVGASLAARGDVRSTNTRPLQIYTPQTLIPEPPNCFEQSKPVKAHGKCRQKEKTRLPAPGFRPGESLCFQCPQLVASSPPYY